MNIGPGFQIFLAHGRQPVVFEIAVPQVFQEIFAQEVGRFLEMGTPKNHRFQDSNVV